MINRGLDIAGKEVHHLIPLEYAHLMGDNWDPNFFGNLVALDNNVHRQVNASWDEFRALFRHRDPPSRAQILQQMEDTLE